jgi:hypothetical protein
MYYDTLLEYYLGIDVSNLSEKQWVSKIAALQVIRTNEKNSE